MKQSKVKHSLLWKRFLFQEDVHNTRNFQITANENKDTVGCWLEAMCYIYGSLQGLP